MDHEAVQAGAAFADLTPTGSVFLFGYPHARRYSTGVNDPLLCSALFLRDGAQSCIIIASDLIIVPTQWARRVRQRIADACGVPVGGIMLTATHTHSGPVTVDYLSNEADPVVPATDEAYLEFVAQQFIAAARRAVAEARPAEVGLAIADATGIGTNRRDPTGPSDLQAPVLIARDRATRTPIAIMLVCSMHPTVLQEDSTLISGDFPGLARRYLQRNALGEDCPVLHLTGAAGDQSPRHVIAAKTLAEAERLGTLLGRAVERVLPTAQFAHDLSIAHRQAHVRLPLRTFPNGDEADRALQAARQRLAELQRAGAPRGAIRTAECDLFGAEEALTLARAAAHGRVASAAEPCMPAEIQVIHIGPWTLVGWPGEVFVEFALRVKRHHPQTFVVTYANGELQGYLVTESAARDGGYEAANALFKSPESGKLLVDETLKLLR
jgi:hypothetical protein